MAGFYKEFMAALHAGLGEEMAKNAAVLAFSYIGRCALSVLLTLFFLSQSSGVFSLVIMVSQSLAMSWIRIRSDRYPFSGS